MADGCCVVTPASHVSLPFSICPLLLAFTYFCQAVRSAARTLEAVELPADDLIAFITDPAGEQSYPIVTYTWLLTYDQYQDPNKAQVLEEFVDWALTEGQKYSAQLGYIPLPQKVVDKVQSAAEQIAE